MNGNAHVAARAICITLLGVKPANDSARARASTIPASARYGEKIAQYLPRITPLLLNPGFISNISIAIIDGVIITRPQSIIHYGQVWPVCAATVECVRRYAEVRRELND